MRYQKHQVGDRWHGYISLIPPVYRFVAFGVGVIEIFSHPGNYHSVIPPLPAVIAVGSYTFLRALYPLGWYWDNRLSRCLLGADVAICILLLMATGGLYSPFLFYSLAPVLTVALVTGGKLTLGIAGLSIAGAAASHLANPLLPQLPLELGDFFLYVITVFLAAFLPYMVNTSVRQHLQSRDILEERQRLSREIHDGLAQIITGIRWQVRLLQRRLTELGTTLEETRELETLVERADRDVRESLDILHNYTGDGSFLPHLKGYLEHLQQDASIDYRLDVEADGLRLEPVVEVELLTLPGGPTLQ